MLFEFKIFMYLQFEYFYFVYINPCRSLYIQSKSFINIYEQIQFLEYSMYL